jgi:integrase
MATQSASTNAFSNPAIPHLKQVREQIEFDYSIPRQQRMDMVSAINKTGELFKLPLSSIPASAEFFRLKFQKINHHNVSVSERRLGNIKSLLMRCLRHVGLSTKLLPYQAPKSPEWQALYDQLPDHYSKAGLSRFIRYCSRQKICPTDVNEEVLNGYLTALADESLIKDPRTNHQTVCRLWNKMVVLVSGWPSMTVNVPTYDDRLYSIEDKLIDPNLLSEIEGYLLFLGEDRLIGGLKRPLRPKSIANTRSNIRRYLSALHHDGFDVASLHTLADMVELTVIKRGLEWFWRRNDNKISRNIAQIAWTVRCIAVKHLDCDDDTAKAFADIMAKLHVPSSGLSEKNKSTLAQFSDPSTVSRLLNLPDALWDKANQAGACKKGCLFAQVAIIVEILIFAPMRLSNLQNLRLDQHLNWIGDRFHINIPADEVKNRETLHFILPRHLSDRIHEYTEQWRDQFMTGANCYLFPGKPGKPKDSTTIRRQIKEYCFKYAGVSITPHQFRHVAAYLLLGQKPGYYEVVRKFLGHKSLKTTYEHYAGAETTAAIELYDDVILGLKRGPAAVTPGDLASEPLDPFNPFLKDRR